jgi:hypothetical protein
MRNFDSQQPYGTPPECIHSRRAVFACKRTKDRPFTELLSSYGCVRAFRAKTAHDRVQGPTSMELLSSAVCKISPR